MSQQNESQPVRVGVVGIGAHCQRNILPALRLIGVQPVAFCDVDVDRARAVALSYGVSATYGSLDDMLAAEALDAVVLVVGAALHPKLACASLEAGVNVWMEKPVGLRAADVARIIAAQQDRVVVVGYKKAFAPATEKVCELVALPDFGTMHSMVGIYPMNIPADGQAVLESPKGSRWLKNGCHPVSLMMRVGGPVASVATYRGGSGGGACVLQFESGVVGTLVLAEGAPKGQPVERYQFFGSGQFATIDNGLRVTLQRGIPFDYKTSDSYAPPGLDHGSIAWEPQNGLATLENQPLNSQGMAGSLRHFVDCVANGKPASVGGLGFALDLMKVYEAALLSNGDPVSVSDVATGQY